jgi:hypothetical protein
VPGQSPSTGNRLAQDVRYLVVGAFAKVDRAEHSGEASRQTPSPAKFALYLGTVTVSTYRELRVFLPASTGKIVATFKDGRIRPLLGLCRCAREYCGDTLWVDIEGQEGEWLVAGISPLMHVVERLVDQ